MDRRTFLKTLAALGVTASLPPDLAAATAAEIDSAWNAASSHWGLFEVNDFGTLSFANFEEPATRRVAYFLPDAERIGSGDAETCAPLRWHVCDLYRDVLEDQLRANGSPIDWSELEDRVEAGWAAWFKQCSGETHDRLVAAIDTWLDSEPDWGDESDELYKTGNAQGAAYDYFLSIDGDTLDALGIGIVEGDCPGSSYFAAVLRIEPAEANRIAAARGLDIRFV